MGMGKGWLMLLPPAKMKWLTKKKEKAAAMKTVSETFVGSDGWMHLMMMPVLRGLSFGVSLSLFLSPYSVCRHVGLAPLRK